MGGEGVFAPRGQVLCIWRDFQGGLEGSHHSDAGEGLDPVTIAGYIRGLNAFLRWGHTEGHFKELLVIPVPRCEQKLVLPLTPEQVQRFLKWKPVHSSQRRTFVLVCLLLDTGMRISEGIGLRKADLNLDDLLIKVKGKGGKHRQVPMSFELRKLLFRYLQKHPFDLVFATRHGTRLTRRNATRDLYKLCDRLRMPRRGFHTLRHTFALNHLRRGGSAFHLQKILGHSTLEMTRRYLNAGARIDQEAPRKRRFLAVQN